MPHTTTNRVNRGKEKARSFVDEINQLTHDALKEIGHDQMRPNATGTSVRVNNSLFQPKSGGSRGMHNRTKQYLAETAPDSNFIDKSMLSPQQMVVPSNHV